MSRRYAWEDTLTVEDTFNRVLDGFFEQRFVVVRATAAHQKQKIDRFLIHRQDGQLVFRVDYKIDVKAGETGNLALEHVSVLRHGKVEAKGWIHTTIADWLISYIPARDTAYLLKVCRLRECWELIEQTWTLRETSTVGPRPYRTLFYAVPLRWLQEHRLIAKTITLRAVQTTMPW